MNGLSAAVKILVSFIISVALVLSVYIISNTLSYSFGKGKQLSVRGVAEQTLVSDRVNWTLSARFSSPESERTKAAVDASINAAVDYLKENGIPEDKITYSIYDKEKKTKTVFLDDLGNKEERFVGYVISRSIFVKDFDNVDLIEKLYGQIELDFEKQDLFIQPSSPYYYYAQPITDIKANLMEKAAANALDRAKVIAKNAGAEVGKLIQAKQGPFNGFGGNGFGSGGFVGGETRDHILNAQVYATFSLK